MQKDIAFSLEDDTLPLTLDNGIAAFDPVTLRIAAQQFANAGIGVSACTSLQGELPPTLTQLADIKITPHVADPSEVTVTIDTKKLTWDDEPEKDIFTDYTNNERYGVSFGRTPTFHTTDATVAPLHMLTEDNKHVVMWCAELNTPKDTLHSFDLLATVKRIMREVTDKDTHPTEAFLTIPALNSTYETGSGGVTIDLPAPIGITQKFAIGLNEEGARVIARTEIVTLSMPILPLEEPPTIILGQHGPVLYWLTETEDRYTASERLPFSIFYTNHEAWLDPDDDVDLDEVQLPD